MAAGVPTLTHAQLGLGYDAALTETGVRLDIQAVHDAWLRQVAAKKDPAAQAAGSLDRLLQAPSTGDAGLATPRGPVRSRRAPRPSNKRPRLCEKPNSTPICRNIFL